EPKRNLAFRTLWVDGENDGLLLVRPINAFVPYMHKKVDAPDVMATSRFPITQFGMYLGAKDTLIHMKAAQEKGTLHVAYLGVERPEVLGNRRCYKFVRTPYYPPEGDGVNELIIYIDQATLMQVGSVLKDSDGNLIAEYFFRDVELNPTYDAKMFTLKSI